jgi:hypothetical protein
MGLERKAGQGGDAYAGGDQGLHDEHVSLSDAMRGVEPSRRQTASSSVWHRSHLPIQVEWRWFASLSSGRRLMR